MSRKFAVVGADTLANKQTAKTAGCTHICVQAYWDRLQGGGAGTALDATELTNLNTQFTDTIASGMQVILEHSLHYPPAWVASSVERWKDEAANVYNPGVSGQESLNYFWSANGHTYCADFITKVYNGLTATNRAAVDRIRLGGGYFGELGYPPADLAAPFSYWGYGASMQTGTGIASTQVVCPLTGYVPYTGTDAQDVKWINWYLDGISQWMLDLIAMHKTAGWKCDLHVLHPSYGVRQDWARSNQNYKDAMHSGSDCIRQIGEYMRDPQVWPWIAWLTGTDTTTPPVVDSDQAAWKHVYAEAAVRGKHWHIWGENPGGEDNAGMDICFASALVNNPSQYLPIYPGNPMGPYIGYRGMMWVNWANLNAGGANATLANYTTDIAANP